MSVTLGLTARMIASGSIQVSVEPRSVRGVPVDASVPVELYASGPGAGALPDASPGTLPGAGTPAVRLDGSSHGGSLDVTLAPVEDALTLTATVPTQRRQRPVARAVSSRFLRSPATSLRLPFGGRTVRERAGEAWHAVTFNAHHGVRPAGGFDPTAGRAALAELDPDVVVLQEMDDRRRRSGGIDLTARWARELAMTGVFGPNLVSAPELDDDEPAWYGNAILARGRVIQARNMALPGVVLRGRAREPRGVLTAVLETPFGLRSVHCVHLGLGRGERLLQVGALRTELGEWSGTFGLLGGDLNTTAWGPDYGWLLRTPGFYDAWRAVGEGAGHTTTDRRRVDMLFPSAELETRRIDVARTAASDHHAVRAVLAPTT